MGKWRFLVLPTIFVILVLFLPNVMNSVGLSVLNNEKAKGDGLTITGYSDPMFFTFFSFLWVVFLFLVFLGEQILQLFGKDFGAG